MPPGGVALTGAAELLFIERFTLVEPPLVAGAVEAELVVALFALLLLFDAQPAHRAATASRASKAKVLRIIFSPFRKRGQSRGETRALGQRAGWRASGVWFAQVARHSG
jgi:hypothetical protein